jgi:hypothetical protein
VVLIAATLGVKTELFREAFGGVTPARDGKPSGGVVRANKAALLKMLAPHGVSNERLDEASDHYRYQPQRGDLWRHTPAKAYAIVEDGQVKQLVMTESGAGYSTPPKAIVAGVQTPPLKVMLRFDKDVKQNESVVTMEVAMPGR